MNLCIELGKIINEPQFDFLYKSKRISIAYFNMELINKSNIKVFAYDEKADYIYRRLRVGDSICIEGEIRILNYNLEIEARKIYKIRL